MRPASPFADSMVLQAQQMLNQQQGAGSGGSGISQFGQATPFSAPPGSAMPDVIAQQATQQGQALRDALGGMRPVQASLPTYNEPPPNQGFMSNSLVGRSIQPSNQGIGGLFAQQMGNQGNQPLQQYGEYLNKTYAMPQIEDERQKISEFLDLVNRAEQAHFANLA